MRMFNFKSVYILYTVSTGSQGSQYELGRDSEAEKPICAYDDNKLYASKLSEPCIPFFEVLAGFVCHSDKGRPTTLDAKKIAEYPPDEYCINHLDDTRKLIFLGTKYSHGVS